MNRNTTSGQKQPHRPPPPSSRGKKSQSGTQPAVQPGVEGEGSYTAARRYNEGLQEHIQKHDVESEAEEALEAVEGQEGEDLKAAEEQGRRADTPGVRPVQQTESGLGGPQPQRDE